MKINYRAVCQCILNRRTASDSVQITRLVVEATNHLAIKFDFLDMLEHIVYFTKDDNEQLRKLAIEAINKLISNNSQELIGMDSQLIENWSMVLYLLFKANYSPKDIPHLFWDIGRCLERKIETSFKFDIEYYLVPNEK